MGTLRCSRTREGGDSHADDVELAQKPDSHVRRRAATARYFFQPRRRNTSGREIRHQSSTGIIFEKPTLRGW